MRKQALNPFLPEDVYIADGEPHVFGDRVYLFGSHDKEDGDTFCMLDYEFFSAPTDDLSDWSSKGPNYSSKQDPYYREDNKYMYAPDCVKGNDGRYYLYYCLSGYKGRGGYANPISVAVCDTPDGKYEYLGFVCRKDGSPYLDKLCFDPAVINDDGTIRLYFGSDYPWFDSFPGFLRKKAIAAIVGRPSKEIPEEYSGAYHVTLMEDMLTIAEEPRRIDHDISGKDYRKHKFFEGSSIRKVNNTYYFIYSSFNNHELCYATSKYPDRDFTYGGTIVSNGDIGYEGREAKDRLNHTGTNHGSIECIDGEWYVFYHRLTHNSDYSRQACAEKIEILPDGRIPQVQITSCGLNDGPLLPGRYPAVICCNLTNGKMKHGSNKKAATTEPCVSSGNGERYLTGITNGTLITYKSFELSGKNRLSIQARSGKGIFHVLLDQKEVGEIRLEGSGQWQTVSTIFHTDKKVCSLSLRYEGTDKAELKMFQIEKE